MRDLSPEHRKFHSLLRSCVDEVSGEITVHSFKENLLSYGSNSLTSVGDKE